MGICDSHRFAFVHVPKAAGESVHAACRDAGLRLRAMDFHMTAMQLREECDWDRYFSFAVVRNPWDRMVSMYHFRRQERAGREVEGSRAGEADGCRWRTRGGRDGT